MELFKVGFGELLLILLIALLVFGPERLPTVLKEIGYVMARLRREVGQFQQLVTQETAPMRRTLDESQRAMSEMAFAPAPPSDFEEMHGLPRPASDEVGSQPSMPQSADGRDQLPAETGATSASVSAAETLEEKRSFPSPAP